MRRAFSFTLVYRPGRPLQLPGLVEESLRLDEQRQIAVVVPRLGDVHDGPVRQLRRLHVVVRLIVEREAAVDDDVFLRVQRVREDEHGRVVASRTSRRRRRRRRRSTRSAAGRRCACRRRCSTDRRRARGCAAAMSAAVTSRVVLHARLAAEEVHPLADRRSRPAPAPTCPALPTTACRSAARTRTLSMNASSIGPCRPCVLRSAAGGQLAGFQAPPVLTRPARQRLVARRRPAA